MVLALVVALGVGGYLFLQSRDDGGSGGDVAAPHEEEAPEEWDPAVTEIADFVADERNLAWEHPVPIRYLDEEAFVEELTADLRDPDDEDREDLEQAQALYQSLGLIGADVDLTEEVLGVMGSGVLAYYDYEVGEIVMRGSDMTPALRVTLAHELTHALQDQHFGLQELFEDTETTGGSLALSAVVEGDAGRIEDAYVETMAPEDQALARDYGPEINEAVTGLDDVDDAIIAMFMAPYLLGPSFLDVVVAAEDVEAIDELFVSDLAEIALVAPTRLLAEGTGHGVDVVEVDPPPLPEGAEVLDDPEPFGALGLHMVLSGRLDAFDSLAAVSGWAGDSMQMYELDGATCVAAAFRGTDPESTDAIADALTAWAAAGPDGQASVTEQGEDVVLQSCSMPETPGPTESISDSLVIVALRHGLYLSAGPRIADDPVHTTCLVDTLMAEPDLRSLFRRLAQEQAPTASDSRVIQSLAQEAAATCLAV